MKSSLCLLGVQLIHRNHGACQAAKSYMSVVEVPSYNLLGKLDDLTRRNHVAQSLQQVKEVVGLLAVQFYDLRFVELLAAHLDFLVCGFLHVNKDEDERKAERDEPEESSSLGEELLVSVDELDHSEHIQVVVNPVSKEKEP